MIGEGSSLEDVCYEVAAALEHVHIVAVLTGGSAATIYAPAAYASLDADFVLGEATDRRLLENALAEIGFSPTSSSGMFAHPNTPITLDFPKGPLAVGGEYVRETTTLERGERRLRILTPTDCVRDRLAHFFHWNDYTALKAAVGVARTHREHIHFDRLEAWAESESGLGRADHRIKFKQFLQDVSAP